MSDSLHPLAELLRQDRRYKLDAYLFVFEALNYAQKVLGMGTETPNPAGKRPPKRPPKRPKPGIKVKLTGKEKEKPESEAEAEPESERHLTGQQLCEAIRQYALEQYGLMAKCVLNSWGIHQTGDFGEIVFNLIRIEQMRKTDQDRREDFDNVFDFETELCQRFKITRPEE